MPKVFTSASQKIGEAGEDAACLYLINNGFIISERNYTKKWGEIDIIGQKDSRIFFFEVKSTSVSHETNMDSYRPEDNMHPWKIKRLSRTIQTYLLERDVPENIEWQFDLLVVFININTKTAKIKRLENVIL
jgi:putative endonuclease